LKAHTACPIAKAIKINVNSFGKIATQDYSTTTQKHADQPLHSDARAGTGR